MKIKVRTPKLTQRKINLATAILYIIGGICFTIAGVQDLLTSRPNYVLAAMGILIGIGHLLTKGIYWVRKYKK